MKTASLGLLALLGTLALGCGDLAGDRVEAVCDGENGGDRELEEIQIRVQADLDIAATDDCVEVLEPYWECQLNEHECRDGDYDDDDEACNNELGQYYECIDGKSTREPGPYN